MKPESEIRERLKQVEGRKPVTKITAEQQRTEARVLKWVLDDD